MQTDARGAPCSQLKQKGLPQSTGTTQVRVMPTQRRSYFLRWGKTAKIWASGRVQRVADGLTDRRVGRSKKLLPAGAVLWAWDADAEYEEEAGSEWLFLRPDKWNRHVQYAWRYDPCELASRSAARAPQRAPRMDPVDPWVTDDEYDPSDDFE